MFALDGIIRRQIQSVIGQSGDANVTVKNGQITIQDVHFDEAVLEDAIFPPIDPTLPPVKLGLVHVKKLAIHIPWGNFSKGFVEVEVDGLSVNLVRRQSNDVTVEALRERKEACVAHLMKELLETLMSMDTAAKKKKKKGKGEDGKEDGGDGDQKSAAAADSGGPPGFVKSAIRKVIEAFRPIVRVTNVHIRYEDLEEDAVDLQERDAPLALGLTVGRLMIQHPDSPYSEIDEDPNMMPVRDVTSIEVNIDGLGVYMHTAAMGVETVVGGGPEAQAAAAAQNSDEHKKKLSAKQRARLEATNGGEDDRTAAAMGVLLQDMLEGAQSGRRPAHEWLVRPVSVSGKVHVNTGIFIKARTRFEWPHLAVADLEVSPIRLQISEHQASSLIIAASELMLMPARNLFAMVRPRRFHPTATLRAAILAVMYTLVEVSGATRFRNAVRDKVGYQRVLVQALGKLRQRAGAGATMQLEDVMNVTTASKGALTLTGGDAAGAEAGTGGGGAPAAAALSAEEQRAIDELLEVDAITSPMQIALWRLVAWTEAKSAAAQQQLMGKGGGRNARALFSGALKKPSSSVSSEDMMAASNAVALGETPGEEEDGQDPLAGAPPHFALAVVNLRVREVSASLLLDDTRRELSDAERAQMASAAEEARAKTVTTTTTTTNLDGTTTTTTAVTVFHPPVTDEPISTVLGVSIRPIVVRARLTPKAAEVGTTLHAALGELVIEHQAGRGSDRTQRLFHLPGETDISDRSPLLGAPMPPAEQPRPSVFGFFSSALQKAAAAAKGATEGDGAEAGGGGGGGAAADGAERRPPAIHAVVTLPPDPPPGELPPDGSTCAELTIHRGEARVAPHMLHDLFLAYFTPIDCAMDLLPLPSFDRETVQALREAAFGAITRPWWGVLDALPQAIEGLSEAIPALLGLRVSALIKEGLVLHLLREPAAGTATSGLAEAVPAASVQLPPLSVELAPDVTDADTAVRIQLGLLGDLRLTAPKRPPKMRPLRGADALPPLADPEKMLARLMHEQIVMQDELKRLREANRRLEGEARTHAYSLPGGGATAAAGGTSPPLGKPNYAYRPPTAVQLAGPIDTLGAQAAAGGGGDASPAAAAATPKSSARMRGVGRLLGSARGSREKHKEKAVVQTA